jgi:hypothetical protein
MNYITSLFVANTSIASIKSTDGAASMAELNSSLILCSDSPDVPPIRSGPEAYNTYHATTNGENNSYLKKR